MFLGDGLPLLVLKIDDFVKYHLRDPSVKVSTLFEVFAKYASYKTGLNLFRVKDAFPKLLSKCCNIYETEILPY